MLTSCMASVWRQDVDAGCEYESDRRGSLIGLENSWEDWRWERVTETYFHIIRNLSGYFLFWKISVNKVTQSQFWNENYNTSELLCHLAPNAFWDTWLPRVHAGNPTRSRWLTGCVDTDLWTWTALRVRTFQKNSQEHKSRKITDKDPVSSFHPSATRCGCLGNRPEWPEPCPILFVTFLCQDFPAPRCDRGWGPSLACYQIKNTSWTRSHEVSLCARVCVKSFTCSRTIHPADWTLGWCVTGDTEELQSLHNLLQF